MYRYLLWLWCLGSLSWGQAQTLTVLDQQTGYPLEGVTLISEAPAFTVATNAQGQADVTRLLGAERIHVRSLGYAPLNLSYGGLDSADFTLRLQPSALNLEAVVVSATRWQQNSANVSAKITTISPQEIALQNPQTAADLLGLSGQVFIQKSQQGGGSPMIRGFATNRLVYAVDGVRMNTAIFRSGNLQNVINLDPFATEKAEVLFGPGSVIYGSDAIGGVMSFQTLTPQLSLEEEPLVTGKAVARYASANQERTGHFDVNVGGKRWAAVTSVSSWHFDHLRQGRHGPDDYLKPRYVQRQNDQDVVITQEDPLRQVPSAYDQINLMQKFRFQPNAHWDLRYALHFSETSAYGRYDRHNRRRNGQPRYAEWRYGPQRWMMNHLSVVHRGPSRLYDRATLSLAQQSFGESRISRDLNDPRREVRTEAVQAYSANLDFIKNLGQRHTLYYGAEWVQNEVNSTGEVENIESGAVVPGASRYPDATWQSLAAYLQSEWRVGRRLTLQGGMRYNQFMLSADFRDNRDFYPFPFTTAALNDGALTGSLGGVLRPGRGWVLRANLGTAFRAPNVDDIGKVFDSEPGAVVVPNPDLQAEYAYNADLGVAKLIGEALKLEATAYYTLLENALVRRDFRLNGEDSITYDGSLSQVQAIQNAAVARVYGAQFSLELNLPAGFSFASHLNVQTGEEELDDGSLSPSRHAAPLFGVSRLTFQRRQLTLQLYAEYQGERRHEELAIEERGKDEIYALDADGNPYAPAWYTLNFKGRYQFSDHWGLSTGLENITDQRYRPYSSGISGPGRNFILAVQARF